MKKSLSILCIFLISLFIGLKNVEATGPVMLVECPVNKENPKSEDDTTWTFFRSNLPRSKWYFYNGIGNFYQMDWCWFEDYETMKENDDSCDKSSNFGESGVNDNLTAGKCPMGHRKSKEGNNRVTGGIANTPPIAMYSLDTPQYLVFKSEFGNIITEYYDIDGYYRMIVDGKEETNLKGVTSFQSDLIKNGKKDFYILNHDGSKGEVVTSYAVYNNVYNPEFIFGSNDNSYLLGLINEWADNNIGKMNKQKQTYDEFKNESKKVINSCEAFNKEMDKNKKISDTKELIYNGILNDLKNAFEKINALDIDDNSFSMCTNNTSGHSMNSIVNCVLSRTSGDAFKWAEEKGTSSYDYIINEDDKKPYGGTDYFDKGYFIRILYQEVNDLIKENNIQINTTISSDIDNDIETLTKCISYIDESSNELNLDSNETSNLRNEYDLLATKRGINVVVGCKGLLGKELIDKINSYLNIIKIVVPIILIAFGIFDFSKAMLAGSEENMKKAQQDFIKRLGIAILIFFVPIIVNFILNIANEVWSFISPDTCGLF